MSSLANFCNRIGIDSQLLRIVKKDNILYNKKTAEPLSDWVIYDSITNHLNNQLIFHNFGEDSNLYADPTTSNVLKFIPRNKIVENSTPSDTFIRLSDSHSIFIDNQLYFTNLFNKVFDGIGQYKMIYPFPDIGNFTFQVDYESQVLTLKRLSTSLINRANLDILNADDCSYSARLNFHHRSNQKLHFSPHYITDFSDEINRKLMVINHAVYDLWNDLVTTKGFLQYKINPTPDSKSELKGHYFTVCDNGSLTFSLDTFFKFPLSRDDSIDLARRFVARYQEYNDPVSIQVMKMLPIINPVSLSNMFTQDIHDFYNDIRVFDDYLNVFEMTTI